MTNFLLASLPVLTLALIAFHSSASISADLFPRYFSCFILTSIQYVSASIICSIDCFKSGWFSHILWRSLSLSYICSYKIFINCLMYFLQFFTVCDDSESIILGLIKIYWTWLYFWNSFYSRNLKIFSSSYNIFFASSFKSFYKNFVSDIM